MNLLYDIAYLCASPVVVPWLAVKSLRTGKYRGDWAGRLGRVGEGVRVPEGMRRLMIHCVSVGELGSVRLLIDELLAADAGLFVILTTTTDTGTARAREVYGAAGKYAGRVAAVRYPIDFSFAVEAFLDAVRPDAVALVELETWPNFLAIAAGRRLPVAVINGRLTARSAGRYALIRPIVAAMMRRVEWFGIQTETIARRFEALGARGRIEVIPTLKYDAADMAEVIAGEKEMAAACGIAAGRTLFVGGSTGPGEEEALLETYAAMRGRYPGLRLAIAPRQPATVPVVEAAVRRRGMNAVLRSRRPDGTAGAELAADDVLIVDTFGELRKLYNLAACVFVGRSLVKMGGSDMIEVAALGKPLCFGPHTHNFAEVVEMLVENQAAAVVADARELTAWLEGILCAPEKAGEMGSKARGLIAARRGSTQRYVEKLLEMTRRG